MTNSATEDIKSRLNIVDFIGQYLRLQKAGANWKARCPFHNEKTPSFMVHEEKQIWHCFGCGKGGDIFGFLMEMENLEFKEALKILAEKAGVELPRYGQLSREETTDKNKILEILELAAKFYETQLWKGAGRDKILKYLRERGFHDATIQEFRIGYAPPGWRNLLTFLTGRGYKIGDIAKTGLLVQKTREHQKANIAKEKEVENSKNNLAESESQVAGYYDRFRGRITFPVSDLMGKIIGFSARVAPGGDESQAKYVNTPETAVYHKSRVLYGIDKAKKEMKDRDEVLLVEGNTDMIAAYQAGIKNTVAVSGTALTPEQLEIIKRYTHNLKMFFDMDSAGSAAARRSAEIAFARDLNVYVVTSKIGKDAAEIIARNKDEFLGAIREARPAMEYFLNEIFAGFDKSDPIAKKKVAQKALNLTSKLTSGIERNHWLKKISEMLGVDEKILTDVLQKTRTEKNNYAAVAEKESLILTQERSEVIRKKIIGLMLAYPTVWKHALKYYADAPELANDDDFRLLREKGEISNFELGRFFDIIDDENQKNLFRQLSFENRYQFGEKNAVEEFDAEEALRTLDQCVAEIKKEFKRKKLNDLLKDIKKAEAQNNKNDLRLLVDEFNKLSKELD